MSDKQLSKEDIARLEALCEAWWETEKEATIRMMYVIEKQETIENEVLAIVLGERV